MSSPQPSTREWLDPGEFSDQCSTGPALDPVTPSYQKIPGALAAVLAANQWSSGSVLGCAQPEEAVSLVPSRSPEPQRVLIVDASQQACSYSSHWGHLLVPQQRMNVSPKLVERRCGSGGIEVEHPRQGRLVNFRVVAPPARHAPA